MTSVLFALGPVFLLILLGHLLWRLEFVPRTFWPVAEKMTYFVFFPALLVMSAARANIELSEIGLMMAAIMIGIVLVAALGFVAKPRLGLDAAGFTSFFQGSVRPNTYVGIAAAFALFGDEGLSLIAVCVLAAIPLVNLLCVLLLALTVHQGGDSGIFKRILWPVITNPLILACLTGAALNWSGLTLHPIIANFLDILGRAALPVGLLAVGAGLNFKAVHHAGASVALSASFKLILLPLITWGLLFLFGVEGNQLVVAVLYAALPVSASSYVLARQMGGDAPMMAGIITASTLAAMVTMPLIIILLG